MHSLFTLAKEFFRCGRARTRCPTATADHRNVWLALIRCGVVRTGSMGSVQPTWNFISIAPVAAATDTNSRISVFANSEFLLVHLPRTPRTYTSDTSDDLLHSLSVRFTTASHIGNMASATPNSFPRDVR